MSLLKVLMHKFGLFMKPSPEDVVDAETDNVLHEFNRAMNTVRTATETVIAGNSKLRNAIRTSTQKFADLEILTNNHQQPNPSRDQ